VELEVTAADIPDHVTVDLTGREIGDVVHIEDIVLPEGATPTIHRNFVIANIAAPSGLRSSDNEDGGEGEAAEEAEAEE
jgi:large subunit ribosomal protein L25